jgi:hypothetical protein
MYSIAYSKNPFRLAGCLFFSGFCASFLHNYKTGLPLTNVKNTMRYVTGISTELIFLFYPKKTGRNTCMQILFCTLLWQLFKT